MDNITDNIIIAIPCIFVLVFAIVLIHGCIKGREISDKDYKEWCEENNVEYEEQE